MASRKRLLTLFEVSVRIKGTTLRRRPQKEWDDPLKLLSGFEVFLSHGFYSKLNLIVHYLVLTVLSQVIGNNF